MAVKKNILFGFLTVCIAGVAHANLAELTRNSVQDLPRYQNQKSTVEDKGESVKADTAEKNNLATNPSPPTSTTQNQKKEPVKEQVLNQPQASKPNPVDQTVTRIQPSTYNPASIAAQNQGYSSQNVNMERLMAYMETVGSITSGERVKGLSATFQVALNALHGALVMVGSETFTGMISIESQRELAKAIGCINSYRSERLSSAAAYTINQHTNLVPIGGVVNSAPKINSSYTHKCL